MRISPIIGTHAETQTFAENRLPLYTWLETKEDPWHRRFIRWSLDIILGRWL